MGWGVAQEMSYASRLEELTGRRVLNAGIASYATPRELALLRRIDRRRLRYLLFQYSMNDVTENEEYLRCGGRLHTSGATMYNSLVRTTQVERRYYPGRYVTYVASAALLKLFQSWVPQAPPLTQAEPTPRFREDEMRALLLVLETEPIDLSGVDIILFEMNGRGRWRSWVAPTLRKLVKEGAGLRHVDRIQIVDVMEQLSPSDFMALDGHPNSSGHEKIARKLKEVLQPTLN